MTNGPERFLLQALPYEGPLLAYLQRCAHNPADAADLLETYARLLRAGVTDTMVVQSIKAFAFTIARNVAIDYARARRVNDPPVIPIDSMSDAQQNDASSDHTDVENAANAQQELELLAAALAQMPERCRRIFTLRKVYGYSQAEIAAALNISENTVEKISDWRRDGVRITCAVSRVGRPSIRCWINWGSGGGGYR